VHRGAVAEIDLDAVSHNLGVVRKLTGGRPVIAVVKADAYGHGATQVSGRLSEEGVSHLAVAFIEEAIRLREAAIQTPIIVLFDRQNAPLYFEYDLIPVVSDPGFCERLSREARKRGRVLDVHVKIDTGMGRLGFNGRDIVRQIISVSKMGFIAVKGMMSHFSDSDVADKSFAQVQMDKFVEVKEKLLKTMKRPGDLLCHMANSAATLTLKCAHLDAVRPGIMLYGQPPIGEPGAGKRKSAYNLMPAMKIKTEILTIRKLHKGRPVSYGRTFVTRRESLIAVLPLGYADGFSRSFSNNADVLIRGKRAPVVGRVCMDLTMVDVTGIKGAKEGDEAVLLGRQGKAEITAKELADRAGTISYEILTSMGTRSRRHYV
jgi:alanine racemase